MKKIFNLTIGKAMLISSLLFASISCDSLIDVDPKSQVDATGIIASPDAVRASINSIYARLRSQSNYGRDLLAVSEALADNATTTGNSGRLINENRNVALSHFTHWQNSYSAINEANITLKAVTEDIANIVPVQTQATIDGWIGQIKFLRALYYHDLVRAYAYDPGTAVAAQDRGGVPIILTPITSSTAASDSKLPRATVDEVYTQIIADLNDAIAKLPANANTSVNYTATKAAAQALLSRVALYKRDYTLAASAATDAIGLVGSTLVGANYISAWRSPNNNESIFEVKFQDASENIGVNTSLQTSYTTCQSLTTLGSQGGFGDLVPLAAFRTTIGITGPAASSGTVGQICTGTDVRAQLYAVGSGRGSGPKIECIKFIGKNSIVNLDNVPVLRKSELLLNRAEAQATPGSPVLDQVAALADLNALRTARGLTTVTLTGQPLLDEILNQRRIEFAFEGHRWFDIKRRGQDLIKTPENILATDYRRLANIPQREVDGNPNLKQNFGY